VTERRTSEEPEQQRSSNYETEKKYCYKMYYEIKQWFSVFISWLIWKTGAPIAVGYFLMDQVLLGVALNFKREKKLANI
jgi:uncharacterized membrane protein